MPPAGPTRTAVLAGRAYANGGRANALFPFAFPPIHRQCHPERSAAKSKARSWRVSLDYEFHLSAEGLHISMETCSNKASTPAQPPATHMLTSTMRSRNAQITTQCIKAPMISAVQVALRLSSLLLSTITVPNDISVSAVIRTAKSIEGNHNEIIFKTPTKQAPKMPKVLRVCCSSLSS
jgi:hypothetical protein